MFMHKGVTVIGGEGYAMEIPEEKTNPMLKKSNMQNSRKLNLTLFHK